MDRSRASRRGFVTIRPQLRTRIGDTYTIAQWKSVSDPRFAERDPRGMVERPSTALRSRRSMHGWDGCLGYRHAWVSIRGGRRVDSDFGLCFRCGVPQGDAVVL